MFFLKSMKDFTDEVFHRWRWNDVYNWLNRRNHSIGGGMFVRLWIILTVLRFSPSPNTHHHFAWIKTSVSIKWLCSPFTLDLSKQNNKKNGECGIKPEHSPSRHPQNRCFLRKDKKMLGHITFWLTWLSLFGKYTLDWNLPLDHET